MNEPQRYSMLRTSIVPTILKAGFRVNVIPSEAEATLDVRALPDEDMDKLYAEMQKVIGDPAVEIERVSANQRPAGTPSRLDTEMYRALEQVAKRMYPGATVLPKGIQCYGIGPARTDEDATNYGAHSDVERLLESSLYKFVEFTWNAVTEVAVVR